MSLHRSCTVLLLIGSLFVSGCVTYEGVGFSKTSYIIDLATYKVIEPL